MRTALRLVPVVVVFGCLRAQAQGTYSGIAIPATVTGGAIYARPAAGSPPESGSSGATFRLMVYPGLRLGTRWFAYSAVQVNAQPGTSYTGGSPDQKVQLHLLQAFVGYTWSSGHNSVTFKAGQLPSAFGSFSLRYDDTLNPLTGIPLAYGSPVPIRADQLPCGVRDLLDQSASGSGYGSGIFTGVHFRCGGSKAVTAGLVPVSLLGSPAAQVDISLHKVDARFQLANSAPGNPQGLRSPDQTPQWAAGAGYTIRQGFRIGLSLHRGPFLDKLLNALLPDSTTVGDYPASGIGSDLQWSRGRWNLEAEWQRFQYNYPRFVVSPVVSSGYAELTRTLTPRWYLAARTSWRRHNHIADLRLSTEKPFQPNFQLSEFAIGYRPNSRLLIKAAYTWASDGTPSPGVPAKAVAVQLVTTLPSFSKSVN